MLFDEFTNSTMQMHCAKQKKHAPSIIVVDAATKTNAVALPLAFVLVDHDHDVVTRVSRVIEKPPFETADSQ